MCITYFSRHVVCPSSDARAISSVLTLLEPSLRVLGVQGVPAPTLVPDYPLVSALPTSSCDALVSAAPDSHAVGLTCCAVSGMLMVRYWHSEMRTAWRLADDAAHTGDHLVVPRTRMRRVILRAASLIAYTLGESWRRAHACASSRPIASSAALPTRFFELDHQALNRPHGHHHHNQLAAAAFEPEDPCDLCFVTVRTNVQIAQPAMAPSAAPRPASLGLHVYHVTHDCRHGASASVYVGDIPSVARNGVTDDAQRPHPDAPLLPRPPVWSIASRLRTGDVQLAGAAGDDGGRGPFVPYSVALGRGPHLQQPLPSPSQTTMATAKSAPARVGWEAVVVGATLCRTTSKGKTTGVSLEARRLLAQNDVAHCIPTVCIITCSYAAVAAASPTGAAVAGHPPPPPGQHPTLSVTFCAWRDAGFWSCWERDADAGEIVMEASVDDLASVPAPPLPDQPQPVPHDSAAEHEDDTETSRNATSRTPAGAMTATPFVATAGLPRNVRSSFIVGVDDDDGATAALGSGSPRSTGFGRGRRGVGVRNDEDDYGNSTFGARAGLAVKPDDDRKHAAYAWIPSPPASPPRPIPPRRRLFAGLLTLDQAGTLLTWIGRAVVPRRGRGTGTASADGMARESDADDADKDMRTHVRQLWRLPRPAAAMWTSTAPTPEPALMPQKPLGQQEDGREGEVSPLGASFVLLAIASAGSSSSRIGPHVRAGGALSLVLSLPGDPSLSFLVDGAADRVLPLWAGEAPLQVEWLWLASPQSSPTPPTALLGVLTSCRVLVLAASAQGLQPLSQHIHRGGGGGWKDPVSSIAWLVRIWLLVPHFRSIYPNPGPASYRGPRSHSLRGQAPCSTFCPRRHCPHSFRWCRTRANMAMMTVAWVACRTTRRPLTWWGSGLSWWFRHMGLKVCLRPKALRFMRRQRQCVIRCYTLAAFAHSRGHRQRWAAFAYWLPHPTAFFSCTAATPVAVAVTASTRQLLLRCGPATRWSPSCCHGCHSCACYGLWGRSQSRTAASSARTRFTMTTSRGTQRKKTVISRPVQLLSTPTQVAVSPC